MLCQLRHHQHGEHDADDVVDREQPLATNRARIAGDQEVRDQHEDADRRLHHNRREDGDHDDHADRRHLETEKRREDEQRAEDTEPRDRPEDARRRDARVARTRDVRESRDAHYRIRSGLRGTRARSSCAD